MLIVGCECNFKHHVNSISFCDDRKRWSISYNKNSVEKVDALILTIPVPQILQLGGDMPSILGNKNKEDIALNNF